MKFLSPLDPSGTSAPDLVFRRLRDAITTGELAPGDRLPPEQELARHLGVSPMTVRTALVVMRDMGFMTASRGRNGGNFIATDIGERLADAARRLKLSRAELRDLTDMRRAVSGEACALAAERANAAYVEDIRQAADLFDRLVGEFPAVRFADARFHILIAEASQSARLLENEIAIQTELTDFILSATKAISKGIAAYDHGPILRAILAGKPDAARAAMIVHAEDTFKWSTAVI